MKISNFLEYNGVSTGCLRFGAVLCLHLHRFTLQDESTMPLRNVGCHSIQRIIPRRIEPSSALMTEPQISQDMPLEAWGVKLGSTYSKTRR